MKQIATFTLIGILAATAFFATPYLMGWLLEKTL